MKKFSFRLQVLLDLRERIKEQKEQELAQLNFQLQRLFEGRSELAGEKEGLLDRQANSQQGRLDVSEIVWFQGYSERLDEQMLLLAQEIENTERSRENKRVELVQATQECEVLLKLKERDYKKFLSLIDHAENQLIDELATIRFSRLKEN